MTLGEKLLHLKHRSDLSLAEIASYARYNAASSIQKLFHVDYDPPSLKYAIAIKLADAFEGRGTPPIEREEVMALTTPDGSYTPSSAIMKMSLEDIMESVLRGMPKSRDRQASYLAHCFRGLSGLLPTLEP